MAGIARLSRIACILPLVLIAFAFAQEVATISDAQIARLAQSFGAVARERLLGWRDLMNNPKYRGLSERQKLELVNDFMNRTPFKTDAEHWGKVDYWATPVEFLSTNAGDCEDFSIAKYFTLRAMGVSDEKLQITYVKEIRVYNEAHMVLAYFATADAEPLILDNINKTIQPASNRTDLIPVYSFNGSGLWLAKEQSGRGQSVGSADRIGHWRDLQARMRSAL
jgi:predicted transglutaminase-like cysteine proteinase